LPRTGGAPICCSVVNLVASLNSSSGTVEGLVLEATYRIDSFDNFGSTLNVTQRYEFGSLKRTDCEPSKLGPPVVPVDPREFPCNPFRLTVDYRFNGQSTEGNLDLGALQIPQRIYARIDGANGNAGAGLLDRDELLIGSNTNYLVQPVLTNTDDLIATLTPSPIEQYYEVQRERVLVGLDQGSRGEIDNFHQTPSDSVRKPKALPSTPGCPECLHIHWRWSALIDDNRFGGGDALVLNNSPQDVNIGLTRYRLGEDDPERYEQLIDSEDIGDGSQNDFVIWYDANYTRNKDTFFSHDAFYSIFYVDLQLNSFANATSVGPDGNVNDTSIVSNDGPGVASDVVVTFNLFNALIDSDSLDQSCSESGLTTVTCRVNSLNPGSRRIYTFEANPSESGVNGLTINSYATSDFVDYSDADNISEAITVLVSNYAHLAAEVVATNTSPTVGESYSYRLEIENKQNFDARQVSVRFDVPSKVQILSYNSTIPGYCEITRKRRRLKCEFNTLLAFSNSFINVTTKAYSKKKQRHF